MQDGVTLVGSFLLLYALLTGALDLRLLPTDSPLLTLFCLTQAQVKVSYSQLSLTFGLID